MWMCHVKKLWWYLCFPHGTETNKKMLSFFRFFFFFFCTQHRRICCVAETSETGRGGRADLALAPTSLHHADTPGVDQRSLGCTQSKEDLRDQMKMEILLNCRVKANACIQFSRGCIHCGLTFKEAVVCLKQDIWWTSAPVHQATACHFQFCISGKEDLKAVC